MKLLFCEHCGDIRSLHVGKLVTCRCTRSSGRYRADEITAEVSGPCLVLGISNPSFWNARDAQKEKGDRDDRMNGQNRGQPLGREFVAFIIPAAARTVRRV